MVKRVRLTLLALLVMALLPAALAQAAPGGENRVFVAHLTGDEEVPTPRDTQAQGQAIFRVSEDGQEIHYRLLAANIDNAFMAHIHLAAEGQNGGIVVWLYPETSFVVPPPTSTTPPDSYLEGRFSGVVAVGTITSADLTGALNGHPLSHLIEDMEMGMTYVNIHTSDFDGTPNEGAGDFPGGEIRGQIR